MRSELLTSEIDETTSQDKLEEKQNNLADPREDSNVENGIVADESFSQDEDVDSDDPNELVALWIRLQTRKFSMEQSGLTPSEPRSKKLRKIVQSLASIEKDLLFDLDVAMQQWQPILMDMRVEAGRARKEATASRNSDNTQNRTTERSTNTDNLQEEDLLGGIFADNEENPDLMLTIGEQASVIVIDYGTWSGVHPRRLLEEVASEVLKKGNLKFKSLLSTSFSVRLQLDVYWSVHIDIDNASRIVLPAEVTFESTPDRWRFKMIGTAARTSLQAEAFLSALCLFLFSSVENTSLKSLQRLPKVWKDLLSDLNEKRGSVIMDSDIKTLQELRHILKSTNAGAHRDGFKGERNLSVENDVQNSYRNGPVQFSPEKAIAKWQNRLNSPKFMAMLAFREGLPVFNYKTQILDAFDEQPFLIVCADTGAGKSTQVPSYILEHKLSKGQDYSVMVTQPRRISAISIARRVSAELGEDKDALGTSRSLVGYAIRMESKTSQETRLTFVTTGVLVRMLQDTQDSNLSRLNCLILDEVHERTMDLDLLFIALRQLHQRRPDLKIVLMSATVDSTKFSTYFNNAPVLEIPGRTFPVEVFFLEDAIEATKFTQSQENYTKGQETPPDSDPSDHEEDTQSKDEQDLNQYSHSTRRALATYDQTRINYDLIVRLATVIATEPRYTAYSSAILIFMPGLGEIRRLYNLLVSTRVFSSKWMIYMLHSTFSTQELEEAFVVPPRGYRKIVIATNIAETGVTIPDITAVIDTCKEKIMRFDERRQLSRLTEGFIARASARQRRGRAARVREGLCFHLVTKHRYENKMVDQPTPEMLRLSLQDPILRLKTWNLGGLESAEEVLSAALDPPSAKNIRRAILRLQEFDALDTAERLTSLGSILAKLPLDVLLGKLAVFGVLFQCLDAIITIVASFGIKSIFLENATGNSSKTIFAHGDSDFLTTYNAYIGWRKARDAGTGSSFCQKYHLSSFQLQQLEDQKAQLFYNLVDARLVALNADETVTLQKARNNRSTNYQIPDRYNRLSTDEVVGAVIAMALHPKLLHKEGNGLRNVYTNQQLQLAPSSVNRSRPPNWICYLEASQARSGKLNASYSSKVTQAALALLLGNADFKLFSGVIDIDNGRIRLSLRHWREVLILQGLRSRIDRFMESFLNRPDSSLAADDQEWLEAVTKVLEGATTTKAS